jgi:hypothetical protein
MHKLNKIFVFRDCVKYLDQKLSFSYKLDDKYQPTDKFDDESSMHLLACERYVLSDFTPETVVRESLFAEVQELRPSLQTGMAGEYASVKCFRSN